MISGHRRKMASELAGKGNLMPCIVRNLSDDEAVVVMVDSNLQRRNLTIRKSICLQDEVGRYEKTGKPHRFNFHAIGSEVEGKESAEILGEQVGESKDPDQKIYPINQLNS